MDQSRQALVNRIARKISKENEMSYTGKYEGCDFDSLQYMAHKIAIEKGWWPKDVAIRDARNFGEIISNIHGEVSEAWEAWRNTGLPSPGEFLIGESGKPYGVGEEFADVFIRIFDICEAYGIPLRRYIAAKMEYNETRPYRHGGKLA